MGICMIHTHSASGVPVSEVPHVGNDRSIGIVRSRTVEVHRLVHRGIGGRIGERWNRWLILNWLYHGKAEGVFRPIARRNLSLHRLLNRVTKRGRIVTQHREPIPESSREVGKRPCRSERIQGFRSRGCRYPQSVATAGECVCSSGYVVVRFKVAWEDEGHFAVRIGVTDVHVRGAVHRVSNHNRFAHLIGSFRKR